MTRSHHAPPGRLVRLCLPAALALLATAAGAADLSRPTQPPYGAAPRGPAAILIPDCEARWNAELLACLPREHVDWADEPDLQSALRTVVRPGRLPYPQLVDRP